MADAVLVERTSQARTSSRVSDSPEECSAEGVAATGVRGEGPAHLSRMRRRYADDLDRRGARVEEEAWSLVPRLLRDTAR